MIKQSGFEIVKDAVIFAYESLDNLKLDIESLVPMCKQGADSIKLITNGNELLDMIRHPKLANIIPDATESIKQAHAYSFATKTDPALTGYKKNKVGALDTQNIAMSTMVSSGSIARIDTIIKYGTDMKAKSNSLKIMNMSDYACNGGQN
jgi:ABC-type Fe3+ transport system substrate-binding protein